MLLLVMMVVGLFICDAGRRSNARVPTVQLLLRFWTVWA